MTEMRFAIPHGRTGPLLTLTGMPKGSCWINIGDHEVTVRMGWAFRSTFPRSSVAGVEFIGDRRLGSIGVHGWRGRWLVNGSLRGLVAIRIRPEARCRMIGLNIRLTELTVNSDDPHALIDALDAS